VIEMNRDLRQWIGKLEEAGELRRITVPVGLDGELAEIHRRVIRQGGPALLFENLRGYRKTVCRKLFTGGHATRARIALMLGLPKDAGEALITSTLRARFRAPLPPRTVKNGPVKEIILKGADIDLGQIPVPQWHVHDSGPYINTWCAVVTRDPENGQLNTGIYRASVGGRDKIHVYLNYAQHWGTHFLKYQRLGKPMPVAMVYGWDPVLEFTAGMPFTGDEYAVMGALRREAVRLVRCETSDLLVPDSAEIVVEGVIPTDPSTFEIEGPYGEVGGFYSPAAIAPVCNVTCITCRKDPIYRGASDEPPTAMIPGVGAALILDVLEKQDIPGVLDATLYPQAVVKIHKTYQGQARHLAAALWGSRLAVTMLKMLVVVDDEREVEIRDPVQVQRIISANLDPARGIVVFPIQLAPPTDLALSEAARDFHAYGAPIGNKLLIDATVDWVTHPPLPELGGRRLQLPCGVPTPEIAALVTARWQKYGL
jgi:4-hydroxy-3-polyprenylbenzoate decarboxylase